MINDASFRAVDSARWHAGFRRPLHGSYCFAGIPQTIRWLLTGQGEVGLPLDCLPPGSRPGQYRQVILFFIDALGWCFLESRLRNSPFLRRIAESSQGVVSRLTSQFPSTTAAHVTTIHTGLPVGQSGVYEWRYFEPQLDAIIKPLRYQLADETGRSLTELGVSPRSLFPTRTLYRDLGPEVRSFTYADRSFAHSPYNSVIAAGATVVPFKYLAEGLCQLGQRIGLEGDSRSYHHLYFDSVDSLAHVHGPGAPEVAAEVDAVLLILEHLFHGRLKDQLRDTLFLMTADHGQARVDPRTTIYLNRELPQLIPLLRRNHAGRLLVPAGSPRDLFLHVREEHLDEVQHLIQGLVGERAVVERVDRLIAEDFFGPPQLLSPQFLGRVGNLVVLAREGESVWWAVGNDETKRGHHGGLTPAEMDTVLLALAYGE